MCDVKVMILPLNTILVHAMMKDYSIMIEDKIKKNQTYFLSSYYDKVHILHFNVYKGHFEFVHFFQLIDQIFNEMKFEIH